ncbi:MAG: hypothetical protein AAGK22_07785 [Acidobacteriota bacterium]
MVRGSGLGAMACAARLARSEALAGRTVLAGPRADTTARLLGGCTLRARALDYFALAFGTTRMELVDDLFGPRAEGAATYRQLASSVALRGEGFRLGRLGEWIRAEHESPVFALAFGLRNAHLKSRLESRLDALGVERVDEAPATLAECRALSPGENTLVVNADDRPLEDLAQKREAVGWVVASQVALRRGSRERDDQRDVPILSPGDSLITTTRSNSGLDMGVFYPFADPLTPSADYYGIYYRIVAKGEKAREREHQQALRSTVTGVARAAGLFPTATEQTLGEATVPRYRAAPTTSTPGVLQLQQISDACTPIIAGDGMTRAGLAGWLAARAILAGEDPAEALRIGLERWRKANRNLAFALTHGAVLTRPLLRVAPGPSVRFLADVPDMWAAVG